MTAVNLLPPGLLDDALREDVRAGLRTTPKSLPSRWRYDAYGRALLERVTELPAHYPARAEGVVIRAAAGLIAELTDAGTVVELGPASLARTRALLDALRARGGLASYVGVDTSASAVGRTAQALMARYHDLAVRPVVAGFEEHVGLPGYPAIGATLVMSLGATFGSMVPVRRAAFLAAVRARLSTGDALLLGAGLIWDPSVMVAAYDDGAGLAAALNKNTLRVLNARLEADFDPDAFDHVVAWVPEASRIELRLRSTARQQVRIPAVGLTAAFTAGEEMRTEIATRFRRDNLELELDAAGLAERAWWTDPDESFAVSLWVPR
ncbi:MAG TPA: L-histidine N(alpha)-methyltransferase [Trebonia sp.]